MNHGPGQRQASAHSRRIPRDLEVECIGDVEPLCRRFPGLLGGAEDVGGELEVLPAGELVVESRLRRHHSTATTDLLAVAARIQPDHLDGARVGLQRPGGETDGGGLARTIRSEEHGDAPVRSDKVEVVHCIDRAERAGDRGEADGLRHVGIHRRRSYCT